MTGRSAASVRADTAIQRRNRWSDGVPRMRDLTHVHVDHDPRAWHWFARGPLVAADGGRRDDGADRPRRNIEDEQLRDVSHVSAVGEDVNRVWDRGDETDEEDDT